MSKKNILVLFNNTKHTITITKNKFMNYMEKYREKGHFKKLNLINMKDLENKVGKKNYIRDYLSKFSVFKSTQSYFHLFKLNKIEDMRSYVNSSKSKQRYYDMKIKLKDFYKSRDWKKTFSIDNLNYFFSKENIKNTGNSIKKYIPTRESFTIVGIKYWFKKKFLKLLFYITCFVSFIYFLKYSFHQLKNRKLNRQLKETYELVAELKEQNKEVAKTSAELLRELQSHKKL